MGTESTMRTKKCSTATREGRLAKAKQFWQAADLIESAVADQEEDLVDAYITMCVHAGIAAADVICCARIGEHAQGQDHQEAIALLASVDKAAAKSLATLLGMKTHSGYSARRSPKKDRVRAERAAGALIDAAEAV